MARLVHKEILICHARNIKAANQGKNQVSDNGQEEKAIKETCSCSNSYLPRQEEAKQEKKEIVGAAILIHCTEEEADRISTDSNIVISLSMRIGGEEFRNAMIIDDYQSKPLKELMDEIGKAEDLMIKRYAAIFAGRKDLMERNNGET